MNFSSWFVHYGLTGTLFIIGQAAVLVIGLPEKDIVARITSFGSIITPAVNAFPEALHPAFQSLTIALSIAVVFLVGLLLDLFGSYFAIYELSRFTTHLAKNRSWLDNFVKEHKAYIQDDYERITKNFGNLWSWESLKLFMFWNLTRRKEGWANTQIAYRRFKLIFPHARLQSFLSSMVMVFSGISNIEMLTNDMQLWRASRAVSTTLLCFGIESYFFSLIRLQNSMNSFYPLLIVLLFFGSFALSAIITLSAYSRFFYTLFGLSYSTYCKLSKMPNQTPLRKGQTLSKH